MIAYGYLDLANSAGANSISLLTFGFTVTRAYLLVAYFIGSNLTVIQVFTITFVYTAALLVEVATRLGALSDAMEYRRPADALAADLEIRHFPNALYAISVIRILVYTIIIWFMWDMRDLKSE